MKGRIRSIGKGQRRIGHLQKQSWAPPTGTYRDTASAPLTSSPVSIATSSPAQEAFYLLSNHLHLFTYLGLAQ